MKEYVKKSIKLICDMEDYAIQLDKRGFCVCSSFGKDSVALVKLFELAGVPFFVQHNVTGIDPPKLVKFARKEIDRLKNEDIETFVVQPRISMHDLIVKKGMPPTRIMRFCCHELKERRIPENRHCFHSFGVRKAESAKRAKRGALEIITSDPKKKVVVDLPDMQEDDEQMTMFFNDNNDQRKDYEFCMRKGVRCINPIIYWSDEQLWEFIKDYDVPYCELYDEGFTRLGCVGCPNAGKKGFAELENHYPQYKAMYIHAFDAMLDKRIEDGKTTQNWKTGQEVYNWWVQL